MKKKLISILIISLFLLSSMSIITTATNHVNTRNKKNVEPIFMSTNSENIPIWSIGNYWKYNMNILFLTKNDNGKTQLDIDADITNMYATVTGTTEMDNEEVYILEIDGKIQGDIGLFGIFDISELRGDFGGNAYMSTSTLGIKKFVFEVDGEVFLPVVRWRDLYFELSLNFDPCFDFFDFPINEDEESWEIHIDEATMFALVDIDFLGGTHKEFSDSMEFDDVISLLEIEQLTVPAGTFQSYILSGDWGEESKLWYSPDVGYLSKVNEKLLWDDGKIESEFNLELLESNYDEANTPPNTPLSPNGQDIGEVNTEYTYTTSTTDPEGDKIFYMFDWGDGRKSDWIGPYNSGQQCSISISWPNKGVYNVMAKAKDEKGLETEWSEPLPVTICGPSKINVTMVKIQGLDELDVGSEPEWFYKVTAISEDETSDSESNHNTDNGKYDGNWITQNTWNVDKSHELKVQSRYVTIRLKLMDYDSLLEFAGNDLADVSGCNYPDNDGRNDDTSYKRGAIYHGTYDLVTNELKAYDPNPDENADKITESNNVFTTRGDYSPDNSTEFEGGIIPDPENDALIEFTLSNDYKLPVAIANVANMPHRVRPGYLLKFRGAVKQGSPDYSWHWDFGDSATSTKQNPSHKYTQTGNYNVILTVTDSYGQQSTDTITIKVYENQKPNNLKIIGPSNGGTTKKYDYKFSATDIDKDQLYYKIDWGDNTDTGWLGPYESGEEITQVHSWNKKGTYAIKLSAKDEYNGLETKTFSVKMPRARSINNIINNFLEKIPILQKLLDL